MDGGLARPVCIFVCGELFVASFAFSPFVTVAENKCETNWLNMSEWVNDVKGPL